MGAEDLFYERFSTETPGFSIFSIGIDTSESSVVQPVPESTVPESIVPTTDPIVSDAQEVQTDQTIQSNETQSATILPTATPVLDEQQNPDIPKEEQVQSLSTPTGNPTPLARSETQATTTPTGLEIS